MGPPRSVAIMPGETPFTVMPRSAVLQRQRLGEPDQPGLRRDDVRALGRAALAGEADDVDDRAALRARACRRRRRACRRTRRRARRKRLAPLLQRHRVERPFAPDGGAVHQHIDRPELPPRVRHDLLDGRRIAHVGEPAHGPHAEGARLGDDALGLFAAGARVDHDVGAGPRKASAMARPMLRLDPVTKATRPARRSPGGRRQAGRRCYPCTHPHRISVAANLSRSHSHRVACRRPHPQYERATTSAAAAAVNRLPSL